MACSAPNDSNAGVWSAMSEVERIDARTLTEAQWAPRDGTTPVILTHALEASGKPWSPVDWCRRVCTRHRGDRVKYSQRSPELPPGRSHIIEAELRWVFREMAEGAHTTSSLYMDENLLEEDLRREVLDRMPGPLREDYFQEHFPQDMPVAPLCFIVGGPGSRSTLHADHLSWTAWNLLLSGRKLWRFYRRGGAADAAFAPGRKIMWGQQVHPEGLAANWFSDCDLYCQVEGLPESAGHAGTSACSQSHKFRPRPSTKAKGEIPAPDYEVVQNTGEMIVFPGDWWHQTYHYTTSVAVCAQYCNRRNLGRVLGHILDWCKVPETMSARLFSEMAHQPPGAQIRQALQLAVTWRRSGQLSDAQVPRRREDSTAAAWARGRPSPPTAPSRRPIACVAACRRRDRWAGPRLLHGTSLALKPLAQT
mmetsp:Transcript_40876/g.82416  ORF Transcript_40876/g.82416 Transcript_40876/m.82416 type:complete len:421 (-) Transcript_40876:68-1330(-)